VVAGTLKFQSRPTHLPTNRLAANQQTLQSTDAPTNIPGSVKPQAGPGAVLGLESQVFAGTFKFQSPATHLPDNRLAANKQSHYQ